MKPVLTRCGYRCDLCLAYRPNVESSPSNRNILSGGWFKYFGFRIPEKDILCDGCMTENPKLIDAKCPVRPCVMKKGLENCSECAGYVCSKLRQRIVTLAGVKKKAGTDIPREDYLRFIQPYENLIRLEEKRKRKEA
jgi:hypothetical protein